MSKEYGELGQKWEERKWSVPNRRSEILDSWILCLLILLVTTKMGNKELKGEFSLQNLLLESRRGLATIDELSIYSKGNTDWLIEMQRNFPPNSKSPTIFPLSSSIINWRIKRIQWSLSNVNIFWGSFSLFIKSEDLTAHCSGSVDRY